MDADSALSIHNIGFLEELYETWRRDPSAVDPQWLHLLDPDQTAQTAPNTPITGSTPPNVSSHEQPSTGPEHTNGHANGHAPAGDWLEPAGNGAYPLVPSDSSAEQVALQSRVDNLIEAYRLHGHLAASIDPLGRERGTDIERLNPGYHGLTDAHLDRSFHSSGLFADATTSLRRILERLRNTYTRDIGVEYWHLSDPQQRRWLRQKMESCENGVVPALPEQLRILKTLAHIEDVDNFLHTKFLGAKRFSAAGADSSICLLDCLIESAGEQEIGEVVLGMAHRGRLNVLMNILGKSPAEVFSEFSNTDPLSYLGAGDVKYHQGYHRHHTTSNGREIYLALAFNPSHLEAITPVIQGRIRAKQDAFPELGTKSSLGVTIHGDAAFAGQGVVMESLNMAGLPAYDVGGMIRLVINNQIGFTTDPRHSRSGIYCTDVANVLNVPVFHVNGDNPEAAAYVARLALEWRQRFGRDFVIDLVCFRKYGHNEGDDPTFTQPLMYQRIKSHPSVRRSYQQKLLDRGSVTEADCKQIEADFSNVFKEAFEKARNSEPKPAHQPMHGIWSRYAGGRERDVPDVETRIQADKVAELAPKIMQTPEDFALHPKVKRFVSESGKMLQGESSLNWATAELMAYASLLDEGRPIRFTGQDARRGTFSHRHASFVDQRDGSRYCPLQHIHARQGRFEIHDSPLSEYSVMGFEFGYSLATPQGLVVWEAQFGDFANGAQVIIDQFLSSSEDKWNRISGLTLMLPHGYEGQGPEHSSARLERFLQLCAEDNMQVCNVTTPAQMFHLLRRQVLRVWRKPLVIMTPKSLLRYRESFSPVTELSEGRFERVIEDSSVNPSEVRRVLACSGKIYYDLLAERTRLGRTDVALLRIEQIYPFPREEIHKSLARYEQATSCFWVQEEPKNMGSWSFILGQFDANVVSALSPRFCGRPESSSPATGAQDAHKLETQQILKTAFADLD